MTKHTVTAQRKVAKAMTVFSQAIKEVESAQEILKQGVKQDSLTVTSLKNQMLNLEAQIVAVNVEKDAKGSEIKKNADLLSKLKEFNA